MNINRTPTDRVNYKKIATILIDCACLIASAFLGIAIRTVDLYSTNAETSTWLLVLVAPVGIVIYTVTGHYGNKTLFLNSREVYRQAARNGLIYLTLMGVGTIARLEMPPRGSWLIMWWLLTGFSVGTRYAARDALRLKRNKRNISTLLVYGAGKAGTKLNAALELSEEFEVRGFIDDDERLADRRIGGIKVRSIDRTRAAIADGLRIDKIIIAIPSAKGDKRRSIVEKAESLGLPVLEIPDLSELIREEKTISRFKPVRIEDILGRDKVVANKQLVEGSTYGKVVLVTGGGGSIGSEICRQVCQHKPKRVFILDNSEENLFEICKELENNGVKCTEGILGSVTDESLVRRVITMKGVETVFHVAAYKHVSIVERNCCAALYNNVFGSYVIAKTCIELGVQRLCLVSTDKAVRPTNVMGASKRAAEIITRSLASRCYQTRVSIVRFGNVLGSSGSVVPIFNEQIAKGGPLTVTHKDVTRFFMTINEAAELVLQACSLSSGNDIFVLDMGKPVRIHELAVRMIRLSGKEEVEGRKASNDEEIEITVTGLKEGEKLYEELLIEDSCEPTINPRILRSHESLTELENIPVKVELLERLCKEKKEEESLKWLKLIVPEWEMSKMTQSKIANVAE